MQILNGMISADSHVVLDRDAFTSRMSRRRWGDLIPQVVEIEERGKLVHRWRVYGHILSRGRGVVNCPAAMPDPEAHIYPERWEEVPLRAYDPLARLEAISSDGVDGEVLYANDPGRGLFYQYRDADFELEAVRAHNDAVAMFRQVSDHFVPLAVLPYLSGIEATVKEVERAVELGCRGVEMLAEPSTASPALKHLNDPYWYPLWDACQALEVPVHIHESGGLASTIALPRWSGFSLSQFHTAMTVPTCSFPAQFFPNLIFSGLADRFPRLRWVSAETGLGWVLYVKEACDHEWERRHLWTEGVKTRPSEVFRRQIYVNFFFETANIPLRHEIGVDNIMWESDYPHTASSFPRSRAFVDRALEGVPEDDRKKMLYENAIRLYKLG